MTAIAKIREPFHYRVRQIALITDNVEKVAAQFTAFLGSRVVHQDPMMAKFGLMNAVLPLGGDFIEVVGWTDDNASAARFWRKHRGDAGYMVMVQSDDAIFHRKRLSDIGLFGIEYSGGEPYGAVLQPVADPEVARQLAEFAKIHHHTHFHPRDIGGVLASIDSVPNVPDWEARFSHWPAAGDQWRKGDPGTCSGIAATHIAGGDFRVAARAWERLLGVPATYAADSATIALGRSSIHFTTSPDGKPSLAGFDLRCADPDAAFTRARNAGIEIAAGKARIGGLRIGLTPDNARIS